MKPIELKLKNVGPFLEEKIDFTQLHEMFLIKGKTGSGKTTIFDAMTYALYGEVNGTRNKSDSHLHSDYAAEDAEAFVDFTFLLGKKKFKVHRTVPGIHTTRTGTQKKQNVLADLCEWNESASQWTPLEGKSTAVSKKVESLIGLTKDEFTQIVVLPQGAFAEFLHQSPMQRKETLSKLFPVSLYTQICESVLEEAKESSDEIKRLTQNLLEARESFDEENASTRLSQIEEELKSLSKKEEDYTTRIQALSAEQTELSHQIKAAEEAKSLKEEEEKLASLSGSMEELHKKLLMAQKALPVVQKIEQAHRAEQRAREREAELLKTQDDFSLARKTLQSLLEKNEQNEKNKESLRKKEIALHDLEQKISKAREADEIQEHYAKAKESIASLFRTTYPACKKACEEVLRLEKEISENENLIQKTSETIIHLQKEKEELGKNNAAAAIATTLKENEPCPVCGSVHHPLLAKFSEANISYEEEIHIQQNAEKSLKQEGEELRKQKEFSYQTHVQINSLLEELEQIAKKNAITLPAKETLPAREQKVPTQNAIREQKEKITQAKNALEEYTGKLSALKDGAESGTAELIEAHNKIQKEKRELDSAITAFEKKLKDSQRDFDTLSERKNTLEKTLKREKDFADEAKKDSLAFIENSGFKNEGDALNAAMKEEEIQAGMKKWSTFNENVLSIKTRLDQNRADPLALPELNRKLLAAQEETRSLGETHAISSRRNTELQKEKVTIRSAQENVKNLSERKESLEKESEALRQLSDDLNGKGTNPRKLSFDAWVLGTYLDEVVQAANIRFEKISSGRYHFNLETEKHVGGGGGGLDLTVTDTFNGQTRATSTLSGGETFMASLSLALALTDVVQSKSGGIRLDALFIDEGFGSLDGQSLDNAIATLEEIREQRTVGIISHVESLEGVIKSHIAVEKTNAGSHIHIEEI